MLPGRDTHTSGAAPSENRDTPTSGFAPFSTRKLEARNTSASGAAPSPTPENGETSLPVPATRSQPSQVQKYVHQTKFYLDKGPIQPEVWPTEEEFQLAKNRIQYDREKLHFAVCGGSGTGKSSLI